jgi:hypothetical protein
MKISEETKEILKTALFLLDIDGDTFAAMDAECVNTEYFIDSILDELSERKYVYFTRDKAYIDKFAASHGKNGRTFFMDVGGAYFVGTVQPDAANKFVEKMREYFAASGDDEYKVELL